MEMYGSVRTEVGWDKNLPKKLEKIRKKTARQNAKKDIRYGI